MRELGAEVEVLTRERLTGERFPLDVRADDVVHLHSLALAELAFELTRRFSLPLVYTAHSVLERELDVRAPQWIALQRRVFEAADAVIFVSQAERDAAPDVERAHVLHNGVPPPPPLAPYDEHGPIVFAGRFTRNKGFDLVLDLADTIEREFIFAGGHGEPELTQRAASRTIGWLPPHELHALFARAALVVMPSRYEPFGMVALEAMRAGAPLLASDTGGLREVALPDSLVRGDWRDAVTQLLANSQKLRELHERGPQHVATRFDARRLANDALTLLHTVSSACKRCST